MKTPCKECISLAICVDRIKTTLPPDVTKFSEIINCDKLKKFIRDLSHEEIKSNYVNNLDLINEARETLRLPKLIRVKQGKIYRIEREPKK